MCNGNVFLLQQLWQTVVTLQPLLQTASIHLPIVRKWLKLMTTKLQKVGPFRPVEIGGLLQRLPFAFHLKHDLAIPV
jgi:hypothetical protein